MRDDRDCHLDLPMPVALIAPSGTIEALNAAARRELPQPEGASEGAPLEALYAAQSAEWLRALAAGGELPARPVAVWLREREETEQAMMAAVARRAGGGISVFHTALDGAALRLPGEILERVEILSQMIGAASDACWCIEFLEPVDVARPEAEIVDQVFRNASRWRACNAAMAELYDVPADQDFNTQPVTRYFPETAVNRAMIHDLVRAGYRLDGAQAIDQRHDGTPMLVENDFRALIREGQLVRLWGTTRDIGPSRAREQALSSEAEVMRDILGAAPDPVFVLSEEGTVLAANPATQRAFGDDQILGQPLEGFVSTRHAREALVAAALSESEAEVELTLGAGAVWRMRAAAMPGAPGRYVVTARRKARRRRTGSGAGSEVQA